MSKIIKAILAGLIFGLISVLVMIPLDFGNKKSKIQAMTASFIDRFIIGFTIVLIDLPINNAVLGIGLGFSMSLPSAIITKSYPPILGMGALGGLLIGIFGR
jgi:uncharacterized membrane protein YjgN (DUF898 family)